MCTAATNHFVSTHPSFGRIFCTKSVFINTIIIMSGPKTISNLLEDALDLIGNEVGASNEVTASKQLLGERSKLKRSIDSEDFIHFDSSNKKVKETPFLNQITGSEVEDPKYWKSGSKAGSLHDIKKIKFQKGSTNQKKAQRGRKAKGEQYTDKYSAKQSNKVKRDALKKILKS